MLFKKTVFTSVLAFMTTLACFAEGGRKGRDVNVLSAQPLATNAPVSEVGPGTSWMDIVLMILIAILILFVLFLLYIACKWVYEKLSNLESDLKDYIKSHPARTQPQQTSSSFSRNDIEKLSNDVNNVLNNQETVINNQLAINKNIQTKTANILENIENICQEVSTQAVQSQLTGCLKSINELKEKVQEITGSKEDISNIAEKLSYIKDELEQLREKHPGVIDLAIKNAIEVLQTCQEMSLMKTESIREAGQIWNTYKELNFESREELTLCKHYYASRNEHEKVAEDKKTAEAQLNQLKSKFNSQTEDKNRILQLNDNLKQDIEKLQKEIESVSAEKNKLESIQKIFFPAEIDANVLFDVLKEESTSVRSAVTITLIQLYWYAQISKANPNNIKSAFTKFDDTLYEIFAERQKILQNIRQAVQSLINEEIFKDTPYKIKWPSLGESASENENSYNRENDEGNEICKVRSAIVFNNGNVESVARIYTKI